MYESDYGKLFVTGRNGIASKIMHRLLEHGLDGDHFSKTLEIGANKGEHLSHVRHSYDSYLLSDIVDRINHASLPQKASFVLADVCNLHFPDNHFDRVVVTCVIQHVDEPEKAFQELLRVLKPGGNCRILLQSDSSILFRLIRALTTLRYARKANKLEEVQLFFAREHKNNYLNLVTLSKYTYKDHGFRSRGWPIKLWPIEIFRIIEFKKVS
jgi:phosphatidylethanolamine/phosphatidyl-N-methylethanolamine N-methyltransferase